MKSPCHICGSTNWPSSTTTCPLCIGDDEAERDDYDGDEINTNTPAQENQT